MSELRFADFKKLTDVRFLHCEDLFAQNPFLRRIKTDSRHIAPNDVFWVLIGQRFDAHEFVPAVALSGALCAVVEHPVPLQRPFPQVVVPNTLQALQQFAALNRQQFSGTLLGLTGSNGKTTTKEMIAHLLAEKWQVHKTSGNLNNHIGCPLTLLELNNSFDFAVVEMGTNHPGEIQLLATIAQPDAALITNVGPAHLQFFETVEAIAREKLSLFKVLDSGKVAFVNVDDPFLKTFHRSGITRVTYGFDAHAQVQGKITAVDENGNFAFELNGQVTIQLQVPGKHNAQNALAAAAVALFYGLSEKDVKDRLESYQAFDQRMQVVERHGVRIINDAYNANPQSMLMALQTLASMKAPKGLFLVLGDMFELGPQGEEWHRQVLQEALRLNPERILLMGEQMANASQQLNNPKLQVFDSHQALGTSLAQSLQPGALVFIKGSRGMAMEKVLEFI